MQNLQNKLAELLKNEENLVIEGQLNKNKIAELALKVDPQLIKLLLKNSTFKKHFFVDIDGILVFDKIEFPVSAGSLAEDPAMVCSNT